MFVTINGKPYSLTDYNEPTAGMAKYKVQEGDDLFKIATRFNTSVGALRNVNRLNDNPRVGRTIFIPNHG